MAGLMILQSVSAGHLRHASLSLTTVTRIAISKINAAGGIDGCALLPIHLGPQSYPQR